MTLGSVSGRWSRTVAWLGFLVAVLIVLRLTGTGDLARPPLTSIDGLSTWADDRGPAASAIALVRLGAELVTWYLLGLSLLHTASQGPRLGGARSLAEVLAVPGASRLVRTGLGVGLVASSAVSGASAEPPPQPQGTATMQPLHEAPTGTAAMRPLAPHPVAAPTTRQPSAAEVPRTHQVVDGESFWTIAAEALEQAWGRPPTDAEIDPYWRALVDANRSRLAGDDPDLILPGQVFELPAPPPTPS
jgi:hypothetical protein